MKVQILQLDPHDDLASARDKLAWTQAQRVVLVWPDRARVLRKRLDLVQLRRQAARQGVELGIVTRDPVVLDHASALGLPAFRSSTRLPEAIWKAGEKFSLHPPARPEPRPSLHRPDREQPRPLRGWMRVVILTVLGLAMAVAAAALLPSATITIHPATTEQDQAVVFTLDPQAGETDMEGVIPARQVLLRPSGTIRVTTSGKTLVPGSPASGEVVFTNLSDGPVLIPVGTGVLPAGRPDLRFSTTEDISLPAGAGMSARASVIASAPGTAANLPAGSLDAIDGPLGLKASVSQPEALAGGSQASRAAVAPADQAAALRTLTEQLLSQAASEIESRLEAGETLAPASLRLTRTLQSEFDRTVGEAADSVGLSLTLEVAGLVYRIQDVDAAAVLVLASRLPKGSRAVPGSLTWTAVSDALAAPGSLPARLHQLQYTPIATDAVTRSARGRSSAEAAARISDLPGQSAPSEVRMAPSWWPVVPWLDVRIRVRLPWDLP